MKTVTKNAIGLAILLIGQVVPFIALCIILKHDPQPGEVGLYMAALPILILLH